MEIPDTLCSNLYDFAFCPELVYDRCRAPVVSKVEPNRPHLVLI